MPVELVIDIDIKENYNSLLKGTHILGRNPFDLNDPRIGPKYKCMIDNNVEILSGEFFAPLLKKYPKRFFKKFRVN